MVCSSEQARLNGKQSRGPVTERGKAIARRNASKHGLLAQQPPLLVTEDLATFEGLVQGLIDQYQPENPVEHFLIQQIAMGMLKQYRLWSVEVAIANLEILKLQKQTQYPDKVIPSPELAALSSFQDQYVPCKDLLLQEQSILEALLENLEYDLWHHKADSTELMAALMDSVGEHYFHEDRTTPVAMYQDFLENWLETWTQGENQEPIPQIRDIRKRVKNLIALAKERIEQLKQEIAQLNAYEQAIQAAQMQTLGLQQPELFNRYQQGISRQIYVALEQLEQQKQRNHGSSIGSFGTELPG